MKTIEQVQKQVEEVNNKNNAVETEEVTMEEVQTKTNDWLQKEYEHIRDSVFDGEQIPSLKMEENKITTFTVDISEPFDEWKDENTGTVKKIMKVESEGQSYNLWLNVRNPLYSEIVKQCQETGNTLFKVMRTGQLQNTRYNIIREDQQ